MAYTNPVDNYHGGDFIFEVIAVEIPEEADYEKISSGKKLDLPRIIDIGGMVVARKQDKAEDKYFRKILTDLSKINAALEAKGEKAADPDRVQIVSRRFRR